MSITPAAVYLVEFGSSEPAASEPGNVGPAASGADNLAVQMEEAYARGFREGMTAAEADFEARLGSQRVLFANELASARHSWATEQAQTLSRQMIDGLSQIETNIADAATQILNPFLIGTVQHCAIRELRKTLKSLLSENEGLAVQISGPEDLIGEIRKTLNGQGIPINCTVTDGCDIRITLGRTRLETSLDEWLFRLREAIA